MHMERLRGQLSIESKYLQNGDKDVVEDDDDDEEYYDDDNYEHYYDDEEYYGDDGEDRKDEKEKNVVEISQNRFMKVLFLDGEIGLLQTCVLCNRSFQQLRGQLSIESKYLQNGDKDVDEDDDDEEEYYDDDNYEHYYDDEEYYGDDGEDRKDEKEKK
ncbi:uncharacterized protein LOC132181947 [Corylus avellana]|uniref:uncharacterized protein LOC132181947 n=1 Tax=Corylus avellana TaxID=13451 RepID=UPI00286A7BC5|nr:uncharacterized protein LOC132181947 [Corylus avellana]